MKKIIWSMLWMITAMSAEEVYATFEVEAQKSANLAFSSSGIVQKVTVDVGSEVKKEDVLSTLQNDDLKVMLEGAQVALKYAKLDYDRQVKVKKIIDQSQFDQYAFKYENAKVQAAYQKSLLDKTVLRAPFDGVIYEKSLEEGDVVSGAMIRTLLKIQSAHERKLILEFDQKYHAKVKVGDLFKYKIDGDEKMHEGKISKIYPVVNMENRKVIAEVEAKDLMVGLFGEGTILINDK
ncbi:MAG: efflux RND transporter periplasmic adaptor subunit [Sulfurovum sp.]|jgi:RND family efflux transporter MFP subunit|nr:efflux RND transporter periplasmic adaptor subunit [Sulfurovum sp.]